ncbi:type II toxin-antitoxin system VapC family toxin [Patescibacteria group bacterium]|nr:type II toxin-antitoxin system VapC family toxin [Patescibacteria group bacterium]
MKTLMVDASVVLGYLIKSNKSALTSFPKILNQVKTKNLKIFSLSLLPLEVANGLRFSKTDRELVSEILQRFIKLPIKLLSLTDDLLLKATDFAYENKTTVYDTAYHLLAINRNSTLLTCDRQYWQAAKQLKHIEYIG